MRSCLIAGCGDVGTRLGLRLAASGIEVHALTRRSVPPAPLRGQHVDLAAPHPPLPRGLAADALVYLPAPAQRDAAAYRALYVDGPARLLDALAAPPRRFLFVSSTAVYGEDGGGWVDENTPPQPRQWNGQLLLEAELRLRERVPGLVVVRFAGIYGPGREALLARVRAGQGGAASHWTNRIHVEDAAAALHHLLGLAAPASLYLGSDGHPAPEAEVLQWIAQRMGLTVAAPSAGPPSGRRLRATRLAASGFDCAWPDYRAGYGGLAALATLSQD